SESHTPNRIANAPYEKDRRNRKWCAQQSGTRHSSKRDSRSVTGGLITAGGEHRTQNGRTQVEPCPPEILGRGVRLIHFVISTIGADECSGEDGLLRGGLKRYALSERRHLTHLQNCVHICP